MKFNILLMSHGSFSKAILESCEMIVGKLSEVDVVSLVPGMSLESLQYDTEIILKKCHQKTLILTDLYGGTPSNVALMLSKQYDIKVISGLNLSMLIESEMQRQYNETDSLDEIAKHLIETGKNACKLVEFEEEFL